MERRVGRGAPDAPRPKVAPAGRGWGPLTSAIGISAKLRKPRPVDRDCLRESEERRLNPRRRDNETRQGESSIQHRQSHFEGK